LRNGIAISTLLHAGVMVVAIYGLPDLLDSPVVMEQPVIVELVTVAEKAVTQKLPEPKAEKSTPPAPKLKPAAAPKLEPRPEPPKPVKKVETPPPPPAPKLKPAAVVMPMPKAPKKSVEIPKSPKKLALVEPQEAFRTLPRPQAKPKRPRQQFNADRIAALLDKDQRKKQTAPGSMTTKTLTAKPPPIPPSPARTHIRAPIAGIIDAIRHQIQQCWSVPAGARDAENLIVRIKVFLNSDGSLAKAPEIIGADQSDDPFYRAAAESARRAVLKCAPLKNLPADKYSRWRELTLTFNPREMLGG
jgi:hypothetical protein